MNTKGHKIKEENPNIEIRNSKQIRMTKVQIHHTEWRTNLPGLAEIDY